MESTEYGLPGQALAVIVEAGSDVLVGTGNGEGVADGIRAGFCVRVGGMGVGVSDGAEACLGSQPEINRLTTRTRMAIVCCFAPIMLLKYPVRKTDKRSVVSNLQSRLPKPRLGSDT